MLKKGMAWTVSLSYSSPPSRAVHVLRQGAEPCSPSMRNGHIRPQQEPISHVKDGQEW